MDIKYIYLIYIILFTIGFLILTDDYGNLRGVEVERKIETDNYKGRDRRTGNGRLKLSTSDIRWLATVVISLLVSGTVAWTTVRADVNTNTKEISGINGKLDELIKLVSSQITEQKVFQQKVETSMEFIQKKVEHNGK